MRSGVGCPALVREIDFSDIPGSPPHVRWCHSMAFRHIVLLDPTWWRGRRPFVSLLEHTTGHLELLNAMLISTVVRDGYIFYSMQTHWAFKKKRENDTTGIWRI